MFTCFRNQTYPKNRIEWIIVDDGTDKIQDLVEKSNIPQIRYFSVEKKMFLGAKRNYMHSFVRGSFVVYMDDDDYYPPERIEHAVDVLQNNPSALCAGASEIYVYFKHIKKMYQCGPYGPNHATAGTFAFRAELLKHTSYNDGAALAEERAFLKDYTIPFVQLDPLKTILVFSHEHNTFDKRKMLDQLHPDYMKESPKTVDTFIRKKQEAPIKKFFLEDIDEALINYEPGLPKMKPDVLEQIKEIEAARNKMMEEMQKQQMQQQGGQQATGIMVQRPGEEPVQLTLEQVVQIMQEQNQKIDQLHKQCMEQQQFIDQQRFGMQNPNPKEMEEANERITELENMVSLLQKQLIERIKKSQSVSEELSELKQKLQDTISAVVTAAAASQTEVLESSPPPTPMPLHRTVTFFEERRNKSDPEVMVCA
jgi:hypothetical protein